MRFDEILSGNDASVDLHRVAGPVPFPINLLQPEIYTEKNTFRCTLSR